MMRKEFKKIFGMVLAAAFLGAGRAYAEIAVGVDPAAHMPAHAGWSAASRASAERLAAAVESLSAARPGNHAGSEARLASFYSGAAMKGAPAPVYAAARPAPAVPAVAAPVPAARLEPTTVKAAAPEASAPAKADEADKADSKEDGKKEGDKKEEKPQEKLWETALAFAIGMAFVLLIVCLI